MEKLENRKRSFNINSLTQAQAEQLSQDIGAKVREIAEKACAEANKILNIYSMTAKMQIVLEGVEDPEAKETPQPENKAKKRGRPKKST